MRYVIDMIVTALLLPFFVLGYLYAFASCWFEVGYDCAVRAGHQPADTTEESGHD